jgi:hypothetical protein
MLNERTQLIIRLVSTHLVLIPVLMLVSLLVNRDTYLLLSISQSLLIILYLTGYWEFFGLKFKMIYFISLESLLLAELEWKICSKVLSHVNIVLISILLAIQLYLLFELIKVIIVIFGKSRIAYEIAFPFKQGKYLVTDGGNSKVSRLMNYHFYSGMHKRNGTNYSMLFATDIVRIDNAKKLFLPAQNEDYPIFGEKVVSPISGVVFKIENTIKDNNPYCGNYPYNTGNTIVIRNHNRYLLLGHLKMGSIKVNEGDLVKENDLLAEAGNSGYSERPHIHMQLIESNSENYWKGMGISVQFKGTNLFKNRVIDVK